jgi:5-methylcytosine-specific restriction protein A
VLVHHIEPVETAPEKRLAVENLQSLCRDCHEELHGRRRRVSGGSMSVTIVCGPPGSGKTTWVDERAKPGDFRWDLDAMVALLFGVSAGERQSSMDRARVALAARDALLPLVRQTKADRAWVIVTGTNYGELLSLRALLDADVAVLAIPAEECLRRLGADRGRIGVGMGEWRDAVARWWERYESTERFASLPADRVTVYGPTA